MVNNTAVVGDRDNDNLVHTVANSPLLKPLVPRCLRIHMVSLMRALRAETWALKVGLESMWSRQTNRRFAHVHFPPTWLPLSTLSNFEFAMQKKLYTTDVFIERYASIFLNGNWDINNDGMKSRSSCSLPSLPRAISSHKDGGRRRRRSEFPRQLGLFITACILRDSWWQRCIILSLAKHNTYVAACIYSKSNYMPDRLPLVPIIWDTAGGLKVKIQSCLTSP